MGIVWFMLGALAGSAFTVAVTWHELRRGLGSEDDLSSSPDDE